MKKYIYSFCFFLFFVNGLVKAQPPCSGTPSPGSTVTSDSLLCAGDSVSLHLEGLTSSGLLFQWQHSPDAVTWTGISGAFDSTYTGLISADTWFRCVVTCVSSGESANSPELLVQVSSGEPAGGSISESHTGATYFFSIMGLSGTSYNYSWDFGDGGTSALANPSHTYAITGVYAVSVIVSNGCGADTLQHSTSVVMGVGELNENEGIHLFPNPTSDGFNLVSENATGVSDMKITDMSGRVYVVRHVVMPVYLSAKSLNLEQGTYFVQLHSADVHRVLRLVVQ